MTSKPKPDLAKFQNLWRLSQERREAWRHWTVIQNLGSELAERQGAWLAVVAADDRYHKEICRLMEEGATREDVTLARGALFDCDLCGEARDPAKAHHCNG